MSQRTEHGNRACYVFNKCRCEPCTQANRDYMRRRDRASRRPDEQLEPAYIDATEVREHIKWLQKKGVGIRTIARQAKVGRSTLQLLVADRRKVHARRPRDRVTRAVAERVLLVFPIDAAPNALVPADKTKRQIAALLARGHTKEGLARMLGLQHSLQIGQSNRVTARNAHRIDALYEGLT